MAGRRQSYWAKGALIVQARLTRQSWAAAVIAVVETAAVEAVGINGDRDRQPSHRWNMRLNSERSANVLFFYYLQ